MKNKIKKKRQTEEQSAKKFNWKLALSVLGVFVVIFTIYQVCMYFELGFIIHLYAIALIILFVVFGVMTRGFSNTTPSADMLPEDWDEEKKQQYIDEDIRMKKKAKKLLIPIIGLLFTFLFECIYIYFLSGLL